MPQCHSCHKAIWLYDTLTTTKKPYYILKGLPGFEPGSGDSESPVLTITPQARSVYNNNNNNNILYIYLTGQI